MCVCPLLWVLQLLVIDRRVQLCYCCVWRRSTSESTIEAAQPMTAVRWLRRLSVFQVPPLLFRIYGTIHTFRIFITFFPLPFSEPVFMRFFLHISSDHFVGVGWDVLRIPTTASSLSGFMKRLKTRLFMSFHPDCCGHTLTSTFRTLYSFFCLLTYLLTLFRVEDRGSDECRQPAGEDRQRRESVVQCYRISEASCLLDARRSKSPTSRRNLPVLGRLNRHISQSIILSRVTWVIKVH